MEDIYIKFIFNGIPITIQAKRKEYMKDIFKRFFIKISKKQKNKLIFLNNGQEINENNKLEEINKAENEITILVYDTESIKTIIQENIFNSIICPECGQDCIINLNEYKICFNQCDNGHCISNILIDEFNKTQKLQDSQKKCFNCNTIISNIYPGKLYKCCNCNYNLCLLCKSKHNKEHIILDYALKNFRCNQHGERYISYCKECHKNLCDLCEFEHNKNHHFIAHKDILIDKNYKQNLNDLICKINEFKNIYKDIEKKFKKIIDNLEIYSNLCSNFINNFDKKNRNYQSLINLNNIYEINLSIQNNILTIIEELSIKNKFNIMYDKMTNKGVNNINSNIKKNLKIVVNPNDNRSILKSPKSTSFNNINKLNMKLYSNNNLENNNPLNFNNNVINNNMINNNLCNNMINMNINNNINNNMNNNINLNNNMNQNNMNKIII